MDVEHIHYQLLNGLKWLALAVIALMSLLFVIALMLLGVLVNSANSQGQLKGLFELVSNLVILILFIGGVCCAVTAWGHFKSALLDEFEGEVADSAAPPAPKPEAAA